MLAKTWMVASGFVGLLVAGGAPAQQQPQQQQEQAQEQSQARQQNGGTDENVQGAAGQMSSGRERQGRGAQGASDLPPGHPPILMLVPIQTQTQASANGCWVRLYEGENYQGDFLTVIGPADLPRVESTVSILGFDSAMVGPKARVVAYDEANYQDRSATLKPGQQIPDLGDQKLGLFEDIESMRITCS